MIIIAYSTMCLASIPVSTHYVPVPSSCTPCQLVLIASTSTSDKKYVQIACSLQGTRQGKFDCMSLEYTLQSCACVMCDI